MDKKFCDRCEKEIKENTYYSINIYGHKSNPAEPYMELATALENMSVKMEKMFQQEKIYCSDCKSEIETYMKSKNKV